MDIKTIECPFCGERILSERERCDYCASIIEKEDETNIELNKPQNFIVEPEISFRKNIEIEKPKIIKSMTNAKKVFITALCSVLPGIGQLLGIIISIIYMNSEETAEDFDDKKSFGLSLFISSIIIFAVGFIVLIIGLIIVALLNS